MERRILTDSSNDLGVGGNATSAKYLTIGLDATLARECLNSHHHLAHCDSLPLQVAFYFVALVKPREYQTKVKLYDEKSYGHFFDDLENGTIDAFPFEVAMDADQPYDRYHWTTPVSSTSYIMYTGLNGDADSKGDSPVRFLIAPFSAGVWSCAVGAALGMLSLAPFLLRRRSGFRLSKNLFLIAAFAYSFLTVLYSSNLKALLAQRSTSAPFQHIHDLAEKVERGSERVIIENTQSLRWELLTVENMWRPPPIQALYDAIHKRGLGSAMIAEPNVTKICDYLESSTEYVYFAYEDLAMDACGGRLCLWRYPLVEYPDTPSTVPVSKLSPIAEAANMAVHALGNYRQILTHRRSGRVCGGQKIKTEYIGVRSLAGAVIALVAGLVISTCAFAVERLLFFRVGEYSLF